MSEAQRGFRRNHDNRMMMYLKTMVVLGRTGPVLPKAYKRHAISQ